MRILITGGAGFIGSHLADKLIGEGAEVFVIDDLSAGKRDNLNPKARFYEMDVADAKLTTVFKETLPDYVYHLAFNTDAPRSVREPSFDALSVVGSANVFHECVLNKVKKVFFTSSGFVYGNALERPTKEQAPLSPASPYSISKAAAENYLRYFNLNFGLPYVIVRFSTVFGPRQAGRAMGYYADCLKSGKSGNIWGDGTKTRDYIYVDDAVEALTTVSKTEIPEGIEPVFNISSGRETPLNDLYSALAKLLGRPESRPTYLPDRPGEIIKFSLDSGKAKKYLGWEPKVGFEEGLKITLRL